MNIYKELAAVKGRDEFVAFVHRLTEDLEQDPEAWANVTLKDYLQSIASWVEDNGHEDELEAAGMPTSLKHDPNQIEWESLAF